MNTFAILLFVLGCCGCYAVDLKPYNITAINMFLSSDKNYDGQFTRDEMDLVFDIYDSDPVDGRVSQKEYIDYVVINNPELQAFALELYRIYDVDGDGFLDKHDYDNFHQLMDNDKNGIVSVDEFVDYWVVLLYAFEHLHAPQT